MWNRRDMLVMATAAFATFGLALAAFYPRLANAVDETPAATANIKTPTLTVGPIAVSAAMDRTNAHTVVLTLRNPADSSASAKFVASAMVLPPTSPLSRSLPIGNQVWKEEYSLDLKSGETRTLSVSLPDNAFVTAPTPAAAPDNNVQKASRLLESTPGSSYLTLASADTQNPQAIRALTLPMNPAPTVTAKAAP
jgi:hypothetical protein